VSPSPRIAALAVASCALATACGPAQSSTDDAARTDRVHELVFVSDRDSAGLDIYTHVLGTEAFTRVTADSGNDYGPVWSPDGSRILFDGDSGGDPEIFVIGVDGTGRTNLTRLTGYDGGADFSPDGAEIVFTSTREAIAEGPAGRDIWIMNSDGSNLRRLTTNDMYEGAPRFSPDGARISFCRQLPPPTTGGESNGEIFIMDRAGGNETRVTDQPEFDCLAHWSPDGERLVFHGCGPEGCSLFLASAGGGDLTRLETPHPANWPVWSPDGEWIAYTASVGYQTDIWLIRPDGTDAQAVTNHPGRDEVAAWRPER
jgi:Tol biopolymer transport system component